MSPERAILVLTNRSVENEHIYNFYTSPFPENTKHVTMVSISVTEKRVLLQGFLNNAWVFFFLKEDPTHASASDIDPKTSQFSTNRFFPLSLMKKRAQEGRPKWEGLLCRSLSHSSSLTHSSNETY